MLLVLFEGAPSTDPRRSYSVKAVDHKLSSSIAQDVWRVTVTLDRQAGQPKITKALAHPLKDELDDWDEYQRYKGEMREAEELEELQAEYGLYEGKSDSAYGSRKVSFNLR